MYRWTIEENGRFVLNWDGQYLLDAYAKAQCADGREIDTRTAVMQKCEQDDHGITLTFVSSDGLVLEEELRIDNQVPTARCTLSDQSGEQVEICRLTPLVFQDSQSDAGKKLGLWKSLWTRMLAVPYDNTMWLRYEALPLRAGRVSYDLTALIDPDSREALLVGALDFTDWKNALVCSAYDARSLEAVSGWADGGSHDTLPHGTIIGNRVSSSSFCILYGKDWRETLEQYANVIHERQPILTWPEGNPFGYNSWAAVATNLNEQNFRHTAQFMHDTLNPSDFHNEGLSYVNLDAWWQPIGEEGLACLRNEVHENRQRAGIYDNPFAFFGRNVDEEIPGVPGHHFSEILLRDAKGEILPRVDGAIPMDVTHPLWKAYTKRRMDYYINCGYDYVKLDFLSHGAMEGVHHDPAVRTGRQAIDKGYQYIADLLSSENIGRPFFVSLSIAPLFPCGWGHARRFSCDAFGTMEDVEYVLNAQTYGWWQNRRLYTFNDPDHIVLLRAFCMEKDSTFGEARARYTSAAIAGGVMMLSDDYSRQEAMERTALLATNREVNDVARMRADFRPVEVADAYASRAYTANVNGKQYLALFSLRAEGETICVDCSRAGVPEGTWRDLWTQSRLCSNEGKIIWNATCCDALLLILE